MIGRTDIYVLKNRTLIKGLGPEIEFKYFYKNVFFCLGQNKRLTSLPLSKLLKVDGNEKGGGSGRTHKFRFCLALWVKGYLQFERVVSL